MAGRGDRGSTGGVGEVGRDEEGGMDGMATRQRGEKKGKVVGLGGRGEGGRQLRCTSLSSLCPDSCEVLEEEKSRPPATLTSCLPPTPTPTPTSMPLFLGHLWARGVGSGGIETACTLTYCHIQLQSKLRATALKEIFLPSFFQIWNQRGRPFDSCKGSPSLPF